MVAHESARFAFVGGVLALYHSSNPIIYKSFPEPSLLILLSMDLLRITIRMRLLQVIDPVELKPNTPTGRRQGRRQLPAQERAPGKKGCVVYLPK